MFWVEISQRWGCAYSGICIVVLYASCEERIVAREEQALGLARNFLLVI